MRAATASLAKIPSRICRASSTVLFKLETRLSTLAQPTEQELSRIDELKRRIACLPGIEEDPGILAEEGWGEARKALRLLIEQKDPRVFLTWELIRKTGVFVNHSSYLDELRELGADSLWEQRWRVVLPEDHCGRPEPFFKYRNSSATLIHHAFHVQQFERLTGNPVDGYGRIVELGGGYGSLCRLIHRLGFQGQYLIFDLPEFSCLQRFFLSCVGVPVGNRSVGEQGVDLVSSLDQLSEQVQSMGAPSLMIATWSLSETPIAFRERFLSAVGEFDAYLIGYQRCYGAVDNRDYFAQWTSSHDEIRWHDWELPHLPNNHYLVGVRRVH